MTKVTIGKTRYTVEVVDRFPRSTAVAKINYEDRTIKLAQHGALSGRALSQREMIDAFWHEVVHGILYDMDNMLTRNEAFVEGVSSRLSKLLTQVYPNGFELVPQRTERLRKLPAEVLRGPGIEKISVHEDGQNDVRRSSSQSGGSVRKG